MQLNLAKSTVRFFQNDDARSITKHIGTYSVARNMNFLPHPYSLDDAFQWIAKATGDKPETNFAIVVNGEAVGSIGLQLLDAGRSGVSRHVAEIGYWIGESFWGRGIVTEAAVALTEWGFQNLDLVRIHAAVYARNPASARVLEKAGFAFEGRERARYFKDGEIIDSLLYAKVRLPS